MVLTGAFLRNDSPFNSKRWALVKRRSIIVAASVGKQYIRAV